jgi:zinc protease
VIGKGLAINAGGGYYGTALDQTRLNVSATPTPKTTLEQLEAGIDAVIAGVIERGVTVDELERSKNRLIADAVYAQDSQSMLARWYGTALTTGLTVEQVRTWPDRLRAVTADDVRNAARQWLDKRRSVTGYLIRTPSSKDNRS